MKSLKGDKKKRRLCVSCCSYSLLKLVCQLVANSLLTCRTLQLMRRIVCIEHEKKVWEEYLLSSVAVTVMLCHTSVSRSSGLANVIFPSFTLMLNCLSRSVCRSIKYLQRQINIRNLSQLTLAAASSEILRGAMANGAQFIKEKPVDQCTLKMVTNQ